jgi:hypothetical protein
MSADVHGSLDAFLDADLGAVTPIPSPLTLGDIEALTAVARDIGGRGRLGSNRRDAEWVAAESSVYEGGLRVWVDGDLVLLLEGDSPVDGGGDPLVAPELGPPERSLETMLADVRLKGGEHIHASRGLSVRINPGNGLLLGVRVFSPTTPDDYVANLRPDSPMERSPLESTSEGGLG